jgi:hypothetical protein
VHRWALLLRPAQQQLQQQLGLRGLQVQVLLVGLQPRQQQQLLALQSPQGRCLVPSSSSSSSLCSPNSMRRAACRHPHLSSTIPSSSSRAMPGPQLQLLVAMALLMTAGE